MPIPYQGQEPASARIIFVGLDANYSAGIFAHENMRERILEYHLNGVEFWKRHNVHHPFLLDEYPLKKNRGGVPYHRKFQTMALTAKHAEFITFVELLDVPTIGSTEKKKFWELFNLEHAKRLDSIFTSGAKRLVLLPGSVIRNMQHANDRHGVFPGCQRPSTGGNFTKSAKPNFTRFDIFHRQLRPVNLNSWGG